METTRSSGRPMLTGLFHDRDSAERAYQGLSERGYSHDDINVVMSDDTRKRHFGDGATTELGSKAAEGAGIGGAIGGTLGAILAAATATGASVALPGIGLVIAGPLAAAAAGAGVGAASGGLLGALAGWGIPEERVKHYESGIRDGGILMGVHPRSDDDARMIEGHWRDSRGQHIYHAGNTANSLNAGGNMDTMNNMNSMGADNTVVAVYDTQADAQRAMDALVDAGFSRSEIRMSSEAESGMSTGTTTTTTEHRDEGGIGGFFRSLFGTDDGYRDQHDVYSESVRRGNCVLTVTARSEDEAERAADVLERYNPVDIDERASQWKSQGWTGYDASAPRYTDDEIARDRSSYGLTGGGGNGLQADPLARTSSMHGTSDVNMSDNRASLTGDTMRTDTMRSDMAQGERLHAEGETTRIPIIEEQLKVGKREVQRGGVRVFSRVQEKPVHETVNLREERVVVERHAVDKPATEADLAAFKENSIELRESAEEAVTSKTARVVEEVVVGKQVTQRTEEINDTVRRTDVDVQQLGVGETSRMSGMSGSGMDYDDDYRTHWQTAYGTSGGRYEDYDAAYRYGAERAGSSDQAYRWEDAEPQMRSDWERNHPESTWERVKDAVRYGAERVSGNHRRH